MKPRIRSTKISKANLQLGSEDAEIWPKSVVPARAFQPDFLLRISSAYNKMSELPAIGVDYWRTYRADVELFRAAWAWLPSIMSEVENQTAIDQLLTSQGLPQ